MLTSQLPTSLAKKSATVRLDLLRVSILINNYNYGQFLKECLDSCINQSYPALEIIVVDDGSTDNSSDLIHHYGSKYPHVQSIFKANGGQASAINVGFAASKGDIIILLDADDYLFPHAVEQMVEVWSNSTFNSSAAMLQSRLELVDQAGESIDLYPAPEITFDKGDVVPLLLRKGRYSTTITSGLSFHRSALEQVLPIPENDFRLCADGYLVTVIPFTGQVLCLEQPVGGRRKHLSNLWAANEAEISAKQRRRSLTHDFLRYQHLQQVAVRFGHVVPKSATQLGLKDPLHLWERLMSLRLEPAEHPVSSDRTWYLAFQGICAIPMDQSLSLKRRCFLLLWFLWIALAPSAWARAAIHWRLSSKARPHLIDKLLKSFRKLSQ